MKAALAPFALLLSALLAGCASAPPAPLGEGPAATEAPRTSGTAPDGRARPADFDTWIAGLRTAARATGIDEPTLHVALDDVRYLPRVVELDRAQPEFTRTVWDYLDRTVTPSRVAQGQDQLARWRDVTADATARYGVPGTVVVAIWGIESNYGSNYGDIPTIDALATLGFEGRRADWARDQLLAALTILQRGDIDRAHMIGSWAGAMGQTQFLPSVYLASAVDADGDGRRDIWGSMADVIASTANFLARSGWRAGEPWGVEVRLAPDFDPGRADLALRQPTGRWLAEGVSGMGTEPLPEFADAAILLPAGVRGPAFLVGANFRTILRYNNSTSYALAVGLLAQRIAGGPDVQAGWPRDLPALTRDELFELQSALNRRGYASGTPDGVMGPATRDGLRRYQRAAGLPADGYPTPDLLRRLLTP